MTRVRLVGLIYTEADMDELCIFKFIRWLITLLTLEIGSLMQKRHNV